jgi:hypothetical protein
VRVGSLAPKQVAVHTFAWKTKAGKTDLQPLDLLNLIGIVSNLKLLSGLMNKLNGLKDSSSLEPRTSTKSG